MKKTVYYCDKCGSERDGGVFKIFVTDEHIKVLYGMDICESCLDSLKETFPVLFEESTKKEENDEQA